MNRFKGVLLVAVFIFCGSIIFAQSKDSIYTIVEVGAEYVEGAEKMHRFLEQNINYPKESRVKDIEGIVYVSFVIDAIGAIRQVEIKRGLDSLINQEIIRVIQLMPQWKPARNNDKPVATKLAIPISFYSEGY